MQPTLVLVHTVPPLVSVFQPLVAELLPGVRLFHILDEPMVERVKRRGGLADEDGARLAQHVEAAAAIGADAVLVTCSTISPVVDMIRSSAAIRVLKIDEAMIREAVSLGRRVGVIATAATTLEPTRELLEAEAARQGKEVTTELVLVEGAIAALFAGDGESHDRLVAEAALDLAGPFRCRGAGPGLHGTRIGGHARGSTSCADPLQPAPGAGPSQEAAGRPTYI